MFDETESNSELLRKYYVATPELERIRKRFATNPEHLERIMRTIVIRLLLKASAREGGVVIHAGSSFKILNTLAARVKDLRARKENGQKTIRDGEPKHE